MWRWWGKAPVHLVAGDAVIFPQGDSHRMTSAPGVPAATGAKLDVVLARRPRQLAYGGGGAVTRLVCGYLACDARLARMLLAGLPSVVKVNVRGSNARCLAGGIPAVRPERGQIAPTRRHGCSGQTVRGAVY